MIKFQWWIWIKKWVLHYWQTNGFTLGEKKKTKNQTPKLWFLLFYLPLERMKWLMSRTPCRASWPIVIINTISHGAKKVEPFCHDHFDQSTLPLHVCIKGQIKRMDQYAKQLICAWCSYQTHIDLRYKYNINK